MAPEVVKGDLYDQKADVWSLGTVLFQMLTGEYPFAGKDFAELKVNIANGVYKVPKHVQISANCLDFMNSCLRFESGKRKSWEELKQHSFLLGLNYQSDDSCSSAMMGKTIKIDTKKTVNFYREVKADDLLRKIESRINQ